MHKYAILYHPGHNRVYFEESKSFCQWELAILCQKAGIELHEPQIAKIGGIDYITFECPEMLTERAVQDLFHLSFIYALFEVLEGDLMRPVMAADFHLLDPGISSLLKYTGKTNELFTRTMINVGVYSADIPEGERVRLLDPIAGKGTTLFEAASCGYDSWGVEIGENVVLEAFHFFKNYLERARMKHTSHKEKVSGPNKSFTATKFTFQYGKDKEDFKDAPHTMELVAGNSMYAGTYFKKESFHVLVGDLPYGVQHGNVTAQKQSSLTRNPKELVRACLPAWKDVLKKGGVIVLSWNCLVLPREELASLFEEAGMEVLRGEAYDSFAHRVDQSIRRDIIAARKI